MSKATNPHLWKKAFSAAPRARQRRAARSTALESYSQPFRYEYLTNIVAIDSENATAAAEIALARALGSRRTSTGDKTQLDLTGGAHQIS
jgi:hypothetical protein